MVQLPLERLLTRLRVALDVQVEDWGNAGGLQRSLDGGAIPDDDDGQAIEIEEAVAPAARSVVVANWAAPRLHTCALNLRHEAALSRRLGGPGLCSRLGPQSGLLQ